MQATDLAAFLKKVQMPTVQHLLNGSLVPTRLALRDACPEREPQLWVALNMILGTALRLRAPQLPPHQRAEAFAEAARAFESAVAACCERKEARQLRKARVGTNQFSLQTSASASGPDGVQMVLDATSVSITEGIEILSRAIRVFKDAADSADRSTDLRAWVISQSNLGCALTLLGQRTHGIEGVYRIEEAIDVLREAAAACSDENMLEERASAYVNLAEAFQAMAERAMPSERLRHLEQSVDWMAAALAFFAPEEYRWLLQMDRAAFA
jgi:hypothetical protein